MPEAKDIIRQRRLAMGLTMKELAQKVGVSEGTVSRWESGFISNMRRDKVALLSQILDVPLEVLMGWDEKDTEETPVYYTDPQTAALAQQMFQDPDMRSLFSMKRNMDPGVFKDYIDFMKKQYLREHPEEDDDFYGC